MKEILQKKVEGLQAEHNRVCNAILEMRQNIDKLNTRRIELEGAMKEILEVINMSQEVVEIHDPESEIAQRSDSNEG